jgi:PAS domain S-box-containing protein
MGEMTSIFPFSSLHSSYEGPEQTLRILIADDHELIRRGVRSLLQSRADFSVCGEAVDGQDAIQLAGKLRPDLIIMDISMPRLNGLDATREIKRSLPETDVLVLSQHDSPEVMRRALHAGARGYVVKSAIGADLVVGIETIRRGDLFFRDAAAVVAPAQGSEESMPRSPSFETYPRDIDERFRFAFAEAPVGIAHAAPGGRWLRVNQRFCEILGYAEEELRELTFQEITHPEDLAAQRLRVDRLAQGEIDGYSMEKRFVRKDRRIVWVSLNVAAVRDSQGKLRYTTSVVQEIGARKQSERTGNLLAAIVDSSDDAIISKDLDGIITTWNNAAERLFGYTAAEAIGQSIKLIIPPERLSEEADIIARIRRGERVDHFETVRMRKDGTRFDISVTISPVKDNSGRIVGASKVGRDITERKKTQNALRESEERSRALSANLSSEIRERTRELEARNADVVRQSELLRQLSWQLLRAEHEQRRHIARELHDSAGQTLVVLAMKLSAIVRAAEKKSPELAGAAREAEEAVQQLTQEIRTTSYLLHPPLLDEAGLPAALPWYVRGLAERSGLEISLDISEDFGRLPQDLEMVLFRLVQECLTNIHRHSGSAQADIRVVRDAECVLVEVQDYGSGIPLEKLAEIQSGGYGVGIRGMRERLRQFQGELTIDSGPSGTTVRVSIPISQETEQGREVSA